MVQKYVYGTPFETEAVTARIDGAKGAPIYGEVSLDDGFCFICALGEDDVVYGLG